MSIASALTARTPSFYRKVASRIKRGEPIGQQCCLFDRSATMPTDIDEMKRRGWRRTILFAPVLCLMLFAPAGTLRFWPGWLFGFVFMASTIIIGAYFSKHDPKLIKRRIKAGPSAENEPRQKVIISMLMAAFVLMLVVPGLDHRWHWSHVPAWLVLGGNAGVVLSFAIFFVILKQNSYAASTVTVEPGQPVVSVGLYGIVRHPMYAGALLLMIATPLALGSYWSLLVVFGGLPILIWRLLDEERILRRDLPGYSDYCRRVRYRLIPLIW
jgi:protein-S-isoprenylcysteine O-methyltransferase Ste14